MWSFGISEGNITRRKKKKKKHTQITCLTATSSREVAQTLKSASSEPASSKWGLNREAQAALLRVRTGPERPEENLRKLT